MSDPTKRDQPESEDPMTKDDWQNAAYHATRKLLRKQGGKRLMAEQLLAPVIEAATAGAWTRAMLRPDVFGPAPSESFNAA